MDKKKIKRMDAMVNFWTYRDRKVCYMYPSKLKYRNSSYAKRATDATFKQALKWKKGRRV
jgi:hypothetical protein